MSGYEPSANFLSVRCAQEKSINYCGNIINIIVTTTKIIIIISTRV